VTKSELDVVVISLRNATARREYMAAMLERTGFVWSFFDAHTGLHSPELRHDEATTRSHYGRALSMPQIAVYSSHFAVIKRFLDQSSADYVLVLEDDIILDTDFPLREFCSYCATYGLHYVRLFGKHFAKSAHLGFFYDRSLIRHMTTPTGMQGYVMSKTGARIFTDNYRSVDATVDLNIDRFWESRLPLYSIFPYPIIERFTPTSIPIPSHDTLQPAEKLTYNRKRAIDKINKIYANIRLGCEDARLRRRLPAFSQVEGSGK
jgi:glycosyl transferase, family 25